MIPDAIVSCSYLLIGCGCCINRLVNHSTEKFAKILPQFVVASIGVAAIGARSLHALLHNFFWRNYPIDPRLIAKELRKSQYDRNFVDWILDRGGVAALVFSLYYHYKFVTTGLLFAVTFTVLEALLITEDNAGTRQQPQGSWRRLSVIARQEPHPLANFWILFHELFGRAMGNNFCRLANVPYAITVWAFPAEGFYQGWSIMNCINDYMMLCYVILMTESLCV